MTRIHKICAVASLAMLAQGAFAQAPSNPAYQYLEIDDPHDTTSTIATKFVTSISRWPVPTTPERDNHVFIMGWNKNPGGGAYDSRDDAFGLHFEQHWSQSAGHSFMEFHYDWFSARTRTTVRPYTMTMDRSNGFIDTGWNVHKMNFFYPPGNVNGAGQWMFFTPNQVALQGPTKIVHNKNNQPLLVQLNAAGTGYITIVKVDMNDSVSLGMSGRTELKLGANVADLSSNSVYAIGGKQVVGPRSLGWTAMTGAQDKIKPLDTKTATLEQLAERVNALQALLTAHGLIGK